MVTAKRVLAIAVALVLTLSAAAPALASNTGTVTVTGTVATTLKLTLSNTAINFGNNIGPDGVNGGVSDTSGACYVASGPIYTIKSNVSWYGTLAYTGIDSNYDVKWTHNSPYSSPVSNSVPTGDFDNLSFSNCTNGTTGSTIQALVINDTASHTDNWIGSSSSQQNATSGDTGADEFSLTIEWVDGDDDISLTLTYTVTNM